MFPSLFLSFSLCLVHTWARVSYGARPLMWEMSECLGLITSVFFYLPLTDKLFRQKKDIQRITWLNGLWKKTSSRDPLTFERAEDIERSVCKQPKKSTWKSGAGIPAWWRQQNDECAVQVVRRLSDPVSAPYAYNLFLQTERPVDTSSHRSSGSVDSQPRRSTVVVKTLLCSSGEMIHVIK